MIEAEGVFENIVSKAARYDFVDDFVSDIPGSKLAFEGDHQDALSYDIDAYGPKVNNILLSPCYTIGSCTARI